MPTDTKIVDFLEKHIVLLKEQASMCCGNIATEAPTVRAIIDELDAAIQKRKQQREQRRNP